MRISYLTVDLIISSYYSNDNLTSFANLLTNTFLWELFLRNLKSQISKSQNLGICGHTSHGNAKKIHL